MGFFFINKPLWKHVFVTRCFSGHVFILTDCLIKVRTKLKHVIKSFEMTLNSKHGIEKTKPKTKDIET